MAVEGDEILTKSVAVTAFCRSAIDPSPQHRGRFGRGPQTPDQRCKFTAGVVLVRCGTELRFSALLANESYYFRGGQARDMSATIPRLIMY